MIEFYIYPALALFLIGIFAGKLLHQLHATTVTIAGSASLHAMAVATIATTLFIGYVFSQKIKEYAWISSAKRVEPLTALYAHPLDSAAAVLISAFSSYVVLGASPLAAGLALLLTGVFNLFLHSDIATPRWLGIFVQRPEMHTVHHAYGHHAKNDGLPLWDMLFGTWVNPALRAQNLGFDEEKSQRITDMLMFRDVHKQSV
jgi:hypothetical protein